MIDSKSDLTDWFDNEDWLQKCYIHILDLFYELNELNLQLQGFDKNKVKIYVQITIHLKVRSLQ